MSPLILALNEESTTLEQVGGKGLSLSKLARAGMPVPDGFPRHHGGLPPLCGGKPLAGRHPTGFGRRAGRSAGHPGGRRARDLRAVLGWHRPGRNAHSHYGAIFRIGWKEPGCLRLRSSATAEDLPDASFAGQQETYLNIRGGEAVLQAVKKCWASLWTARAIAYRLKNKVDQSGIALAVVVQELVDAQAAGILFTVNPVDGDADEVVINAAWGLGEAVVSGIVSPDFITTDKSNGQVKQYDVAEKAIMTVRTAKGTRDKVIKGRKRKARVLSDAQVAELVKLARQIEDFYQAPQDIEWGLG